MIENDIQKQEQFIRAFEKQCKFYRFNIKEQYILNDSDIVMTDVVYNYINNSNENSFKFLISSLLYNMLKTKEFSVFILLKSGNEFISSKVMFLAKNKNLIKFIDMLIEKLIFYELYESINDIKSIKEMIINNEKNANI